MLQIIGLFTFYVQKTIMYIYNLIFVIVFENSTTYSPKGRGES